MSIEFSMNNSANAEKNKVEGQKTPTFSEAGKKEFASEIGITNKNVEDLKNIPDAAAKLDSDPTLKEKELKRGKFLAEIAIGAGLTLTAAIFMKDAGAATSGAEIMTHMLALGGGLAIFLKGVLDSNITGSPDVRQSR